MALPAFRGGGGRGGNEKRQRFARFYFLSDDELLEVLAQCGDPRNVQRHLRRVFEFVDAVALPTAWRPMGAPAELHGKCCVSWFGSRVSEIPENTVFRI